MIRIGIPSEKGSKFSKRNARNATKTRQTTNFLVIINGRIRFGSSPLHAISLRNGIESVPTPEWVNFRGIAGRGNSIVGRIFGVCQFWMGRFPERVNFRIGPSFAVGQFRSGSNFSELVDFRSGVTLQKGLPELGMDRANIISIDGPERKPKQKWAQSFETRRKKGRKTRNETTLLVFIMCQIHLEVGHTSERRAKWNWKWVNSVVGQFRKNSGAVDSEVSQSPEWVNSGWVAFRSGSISGVGQFTERANFSEWVDFRCGPIQVWANFPDCQCWMGRSSGVANLRGGSILEGVDFFGAG